MEKPKKRRWPWLVAAAAAALLLPVLDYWNLLPHKTYKTTPNTTPPTLPGATRRKTAGSAPMWCGVPSKMRGTTLRR